MTATATDFRALTGTYTFDPAHSRLGFVARHAMVTKVRGAFNEFEGSAVDRRRRPGQVQRLRHHRGRQHRHPQRAARRPPAHQRLPRRRAASRRSPSSRPRSSTTAATTSRSPATSPIKDVTKPVTIPLEYQGAAKDPFGNDRIGFEGSVAVNRKDCGITYNAALETGGVLVSDKITLEFEISAIKSA